MELTSDSLKKPPEFVENSQNDDWIVKGRCQQFDKCVTFNATDIKVDFTMDIQQCIAWTKEKTSNDFKKVADFFDWLKVAFSKAQSSVGINSNQDAQDHSVEYGGHATIDFSK